MSQMQQSYASSPAFHLVDLQLKTQTQIFAKQLLS